MTAPASICITDPGLLTTIQDQGRPGYAHLGVPRAGPVDSRSARLANRLVGNSVECAVLETTLTGVCFTVDSALTMAVTGAVAEVWVNDRACAWGEAISVPAASRVRLGPATLGVRSYLAFGGGIAVAPVLGSRSTDTLSFVGPPVLVAGVVLPIGRPAAQPPESPPVAINPSAAEVILLRMHHGPRRDWFTTEAIEVLHSSAYVVTPASNRIGLRLVGSPVLRSQVGAGELASEGMVLGSVQIPPAGNPVVFLNDHPVTGGYPVVGVVDRRDLDQCGQLGAGDSIRFVAV